MDAIVDIGGLSPRRAGAHEVPTDGGTWTLAHRPEAVGEARKITEEALGRWNLPRDAAHEVLLVVSELVTNAVEHAMPPVGLHLGSSDLGTGRVRVEVTDGGPATSEGEWAAGCCDGEHGRGLYIIDHLAVAHGDSWETGRAIHWADFAFAA